MTRRARQPKRSVLGRLLEALANLVLLLIILAFGISIATHILKGERAAKADPPFPQAAAAKAERGAPTRPVSSPPEPVSAVPNRERSEDPSPSTEELRSRATVDLRNGCRRVRLAEDLARSMRRARFDVLEYRNADRYDYPRTLIKERGNKPEAAAAVRDWLRKEYGVGEIAHDPKLTTAADVLVILGADLADTLRHRERTSR